MSQSSPGRRGLVFFACCYAAAAPLSAHYAAAACVGLALSLAWVLVQEKRMPDVRLADAQWVLAAYLVVALLSAVQGVDPARSLRGLKADADMVLVALLFAAAFALETAPQAAWFMAAGFAVSALHGIGRTILWFIKTHDWVMARGTVHHITWGEVLTFGLLGGVSAYAFADRAPFKGRKRRLAAYCFLLGTALILSQARGPWLACTAALAAVAVFRREARRAVAAGAACVAVFFLAAPALARPFYERFLSIFDPKETANAIRFQLWDLALRVFRERPVLGVGPDNFAVRVRELHPGPFEDTMLHPQAHNLYLHQLAERGAAGLLMLLALLGFLWYAALRRWRRAPDWRSLWLLAALSGFWVMNLTQASLETPTVWMLLMFLFTWTMRNEESRS